MSDSGVVSDSVVELGPDEDPVGLSASVVVVLPVLTVVVVLEKLKLRSSALSVPQAAVTPREKISARVKIRLLVM